MEHNLTYGRDICIKLLQYIDLEVLYNQSTYDNTQHRKGLQLHVLFIFCLTLSKVCEKRKKKCKFSHG